MNTVYVVTSGEYSDYSIEAIYEDRETADAHVTRLGDATGYRSVEEWEVKPKGDTSYRHITDYSVALGVTEDGKILDKVYEYEYNHTGDSTEPARTWLSAGGLDAAWTIQAESNVSEEHCLKVARERAAQVCALIAQGLPVTGVREWVEHA